ncbi:phosphohydrolase [Desulfonema ishimotonii]|uniref:Phosphohydrolase n=1 Tax=Desulfonema ishimotonii TaxID=45657 RepID=A0A401G2W9_9BACT|nr:HD domain-containing protein [Desulfonema ishimotonii]GBC63521.1 phosphohydrolase [Desulfonema ishimotonii]
MDAEYRQADSEANLVEQVRAQVRHFFEDARGSHGWDHTRRVCRLCEQIGAAEQADMTVLRIAALLHDIGRADQDRANGEICHARQGAKRAVPLLRPLDLSAERKENILHCIRCHRFRGENVPETPEAKVLFDADKLDGIGAVGVARAYLFAGEIGARLHSSGVPPEETAPYSREDTGYREFRVKLCGVKDRMLTPTGRKMAEDRHAFMTAFFDRFLAEYEGRL